MTKARVSNVASFSKLLLTYISALLHVCLLPAVRCADCGAAPSTGTHTAAVINKCVSAMRCVFAGHLQGDVQTVVLRQAHARLKKVSLIYVCAMLYVCCLLLAG
jgi:hypothetical protein